MNHLLSIYIDKIIDDDDDDHKYLDNRQELGSIPSFLPSFLTLCPVNVVIVWKGRPRTMNDQTETLDLNPSGG
jgi:hypothetical protein